MALTCAVALATDALGPGSLDRVVLGDGDQPGRRRRPLHVRRRLGRLLVRPCGVHGDRRVHERDPRDPARDEAVRPAGPAVACSRARTLDPFLATLAAGCLAAAFALVLVAPARPPLGPHRGPRDVRRPQHRQHRRAQLGAGHARHGRRVRDPDDDDDRGSAGVGARGDGRRVGCSSARASACACAPRARTRPPPAPIGIAVARERTIAFVLSAFFVGVAGALFGMFIGSFNPDAFFLDITFLMVVMLVIGGTGSLAGAVLGTLVISAVSELLRRVEGGVDLGVVQCLGQAGHARDRARARDARDPDLPPGRSHGRPRALLARAPAARRPPNRGARGASGGEALVSIRSRPGEDP